MSKVREVWLSRLPVLIVAVVLCMLTARAALADCTVVTGNETAGCTLSAPGQPCRFKGAPP